MAQGALGSNPTIGQTKKEENTVWFGRIALICTLVLMAVTLGFVSFRVVKRAETALARTHFDTIAERALLDARRTFSRKRRGAVSMATVISQTHPEPSAYPFVTVVGFEQISTDIIETVASNDLAFLPLVTPEQLPEFEEYAYQHYETSESPVFPNGTAVSSFGKGVWGMHPTLNTTDLRYRDYGQGTYYSNRHNVVTPVFQINTGPHNILLLNVHSEHKRGAQIDGALDCARNSTSGDEKTDCTVCGGISDLMYIRNERGREEGNAPGAVFFEPIFPSNGNGCQIGGFVASTIVWDEVLEYSFTESVRGIDCVLESDSTAFTYEVVDGLVREKGEGDIHDSKYDNEGRDVILTIPDEFHSGAVHYTLTLYPNDDLFDVYSTVNPLLISLAAVFLIILTTVIFMIYDSCVRRQFHAHRLLLESRRQFVRFVSHEVRTPLNSVCMGLALLTEEFASHFGFERAALLTRHLEMGPGQNLRLANKDRRGPGKLDPTVCDWFRLTKEVLSNAQGAVNVLNDLLNYDKIEAGQMRLELCDVPIWSLIERTMKEFMLPAAQKKITMQLFFSDERGGDQEESRVVSSTRDITKDMRLQRVNGDNVRLQQVLRNLISNALKFTPEQQDIKIEASWTLSKPSSPLNPDWGFIDGLMDKKATTESVTKEDETDKNACHSGYAIVKVSDTGAGMSKEQLSCLFRDGVQFNANQLQAGQGSGIGLFVSKGLVEQHGGILEASSEGLGHGTTFTISLPLHQVLHQEESSRRGSSFGSVEMSNVSDRASAQSKHILVVDDVLSNRKLLSRLLTKHGHTCETAEDGAVAVEKVSESMRKSTPYDTVLLDYEMPVMNGPVAAKTIRSNGFVGQIFGLTGNVLPDDIHFFVSCGVDGVIGKPFKMSTLVSLWAECSGEA